MQDGKFGKCYILNSQFTGDIPKEVEMNTRKFFVALLLTMILTLATVGPALADQPEIVNLSLHRHDEEFAVCDGYNVIGDFNVTRRDVTYFDNDRSPIRVDLFIHYEGTLTNSVTGKTLPDKGNFKNSIDLANGTATVTGGIRHTTVSGLGIVIQDTGRIILDDATGGILFVTPGMASDETLQLCAALR
jgi:hypothetical protein